MTSCTLVCATHVWCCRLAIQNVYVTAKRDSVAEKRTPFSSCHRDLAYDFDLSSVKVNQRAKYLGEMSFSLTQKLLSEHRDTHTRPCAYLDH